MPALSFDFQVDGLMQTMRFAESRIENLKPPLREWAREKRAQVKEDVAAGVNMVPLAASTLARRELAARGTNRLTVDGQARASYLKKLEKQQKRLTGLENWAKGRFAGFGRFAVPAKVKEKIERQRKQVESLARAVETSQRQQAQLLGLEARVKSEADQLLLRKLRAEYKRASSKLSPAAAARRQEVLHAFEQMAQGKPPKDERVAQLIEKLKGRHERARAKAAAKLARHKILGQIPNTLVSQVAQQGQEWLVGLTSRWGGGSKAHNEGATVGHGATLPARTYLVLTPQDVERLQEKLIRWGLAPLQGAA